MRYYCGNCGAHLFAGSMYCEKCNAPVDWSSTPIAEAVKEEYGQTTAKKSWFWETSWIDVLGQGAIGGLVLGAIAYGLLAWVVWLIPLSVELPPEAGYVVAGIGMGALTMWMYCSQKNGHPPKVEKCTQKEEKPSSRTGCLVVIGTLIALIVLTMIKFATL